MLYKEPKVSVLHANAKLAQESSRVLDLEPEVLGSVFTGGNILLLEFFVFT